MCMSTIFSYGKDEFIYETSWEDGHKMSSFDVALQSKWQSALEKGCFRYELNIRDTKRLPGKYSFLAQLNPDRATNRRPPEDIRCLTQPFDHEKFNFTKISKDEILFEIKCEEESNIKSRGEDLVAINISPLEYCHSLFLPQVSSCLPQILTLYSLQRTLELMLLSITPALRAGFNSLCGFATVNHLHFHLYYLKHSMLLENIEVVNLSGECYILTQYPAKCFAFQLNKSHDLPLLARCVYKLTNYLQNNNIAHNVYITRGSSFEDTKSNKLDTLRVYIWARQHSSGFKNVHCFDPAICELFGHLVVKDPKPFVSLTERDVVNELHKICDETFDLVFDDVRSLFENEEEDRCDDDDDDNNNDDDDGGNDD